MKTVILGSTGMVGSVVLKKALESQTVKEVIIINRKPINIKHNKLKEIIHDDFLNYEKVLKHFVKTKIAYFCIGAYTGALPRNKFREINVDIPKIFATEFFKLNPNATFCLLSGMGADRTEKSKIQFARDKGAIENFLLQYENVKIFRPGYIYPVIPRKEPNLAYFLSRQFYPLIKLLMPNNVITSFELGEVIFQKGLTKGKTTFENKDMKALLKGS